MTSTVLARPTGAAARIARHWPEALVLAGGGALVAGLALEPAGEGLPPADPLLEPAVIALAAMALAGVLRAWRGWPIASGLALALVAAVAFFAGPAPVVATLMLATTALVVGHAVAGARDAVPVGLALVAGTVGWLLPLPVHVQWGYVLAFAAAAILGRRALVDACASGRSTWRQAVERSPAGAAGAMLALLLASTGCWLPTMQFDDIAYHLGLPYQLQAAGRYALDPDHQVWALAPWAGDVLQGIAQVVAGAEARGAVNLMWLLAAAAGLHRLAGLLGAPGWACWGAVGLFATIPMTQSLAAGMQTELPAVATAVALACLVAGDADGARPARSAVAGGALFGLLCALKAMHAATALPLLVWAAWRHRRALTPLRVALAGATAAVVGGSSYTYAWIVAGNPVLPLFNATFGSPFFPARDFMDERWRHGLDPTLPWDLTFDTARFYEGYDGAIGLLLVGAAGAWCLALADRRTRGLALAATGGLVVAILPMQYARYLYPALVLLVPALVAAVARAMPAWRAIALLVALCLGQFAFHGSGYWMLRNGAVRDTVRAAGADAPLYEAFAPERALAARMRQDASARDGRVLVMGTEPAVLAELGARSRTTSWYSSRLGAEGTRANQMADGRGWEALLRREGVTHVLLREPALTDAQRAGLARVGARRVDAVGVAEWWRVPAPAVPEPTP